MHAVPGPASRTQVGVAAHRSAPRRAESDALTALLADTADGDVDAFAALYDCTCARLYGVALRLLRDPGLAEQTTQDVYLQIWHTAALHDPTKDSAQAWLTTLTHRRAVERLRFERAHTQRMLRYDNGIRVGGDDDVIDEVISLAYYDGMTYREAAEHLGVTLPAVTARIHTELTRLRQSVGTP